MNRKARRAQLSKGIDVSRSQKEIQQEYAQLCMQAGDLQYRKTQHQEELNLLSEGLNGINQKIRKLNVEMKAAIEAQSTGASEELSKEPEVKNEVVSA
jgi:hypothetical protein